MFYRAPNPALSIPTIAMPDDVPVVPSAADAAPFAAAVMAKYGLVNVDAAGARPRFRHPASACDVACKSSQRCARQLS